MSDEVRRGDGRRAGQRPDPPHPDQANLHEAALRYLARYGCSVAGLTRVLDRRVARWTRAVQPGPDAAEAARAAVRVVVARIAAAGAVDDAAFAEARARSLTRAGRSRRAIAAHLASRGIDPALARAALPDDPEHDLAAALTLARRRRAGPFRAAPEADPPLRRRELAALARGGFAEALARRALDMPRAEAEALLLRRRREAG